MQGGTVAGPKWGSSVQKQFRETLAYGKIAESQLINWLRFERGFTIIPAYEIEHPCGKGPRVLTPHQGLVSPDALGIKGADIKWFEVKHKNHFTWHRNTKRWTTGIDKHHYEDYLRVANHFGWPVWMLFLHKDPKPRADDIGHGCPAVCPTGLFCGEIVDLASKINHPSNKWGRHGMVYWAIEDAAQGRHGLRRIASVADVLRAQMRVPDVLSDEPPF